MIYNEVAEDEKLYFKKFNNKSLVFKIAILSVIAFLTASVSISGIFPASYAMLGIGAVFNVPLIVIALICSFSMLVFSSGTSAIVAFLITFIVFSLVSSLLNINGISVKYGVLIKLVISIVLVMSINVLFLGFSITHAVLLLITSVLIYLVYVYGTSVVLNARKGFVFAEEENLALICMVTFMLSTFSNIQLYSIRISNIILIMIVLVYGYRKGIILGCTTRIFNRFNNVCFNWIK